MEINVRYCLECPFFFEGEEMGGYECNADSQLNLGFCFDKEQKRKVENAVHEKCPLKKGSVQVVLTIQ